MAAEEGSNFVTIAAGRHGAPAAAVRTGVIVEKEAAGGIRAATNGRARPFDEEIGGGTGDSGEEPLEAALACNELEGPCTFTKDELIMSFRDAQDFVHRLGPGRRKRLFVDDRSENGSERLTKAKGAKQDGVDGAGFRGKKRAQARGALLRDQAGVHEEGDKLVPGEMVSRSDVGKVECETASDKRRLGSGLGDHERGLTLMRTLDAYITGSKVRSRGREAGWR